MEHELDEGRAGHALGRLEALARNLRWSWDQATMALFMDLDPELWQATGHNPVAMLRRMSPDRLDERLADPAFQSRLNALAEDLAAYMGDSPRGQGRDELTAYFCAEFGITECLRAYSGGLGVLAGDHLKAASDLGLPLVGVGLLYHEGYFRQHVAASGEQTETYAALDFHSLPIDRATTDDGDPVEVAVAFPGRSVRARVWQARVGRVALYLLDTDIPANGPEDRRITAQLYGGDDETRIAQEIILGIGGVRALRALGIQPAVYHMNEGHSAFLGLEHLRALVREEGMSLAEARDVVAARTVFTTHTPVPAGHDRFTPELMAPYFNGFAEELDIPLEDILALGRVNPRSVEERFSMTVLAVRLAGRRNGVSRLHGAVSRSMMARLWPELDAGDVPIGHVTNGVHTASWVAPEMQALLDRYVGRAWRVHGGSMEEWSALEAVPDEELWRLRTLLRHRLVGLIERKGPTAPVRLDPEALTIGFARRFATYKRATLVLRDVERLARLVNRPGRPVQFVFAGKAHPRDEPGKAFIRELVEASQRKPFRGRIAFLENYDIAVARSLVSGVDLWLNNPRRPQEASGTSGMKAALNGGLNVSVLDGWWDEAYRDALARAVPIGWAIGEGLDADQAGGAGRLDELDARALYRVLEEEVVPAFYDRDENGRPLRWIALMRNAIRTVGPAFNAHRMVRDYAEGYYRPAAGASAAPAALD